MCLVVFASTLLSNSIQSHHDTARMIHSLEIIWFTLFEVIVGREANQRLYRTQVGREATHRRAAPIVLGGSFF